MNEKLKNAIYKIGRERYREKRLFQNREDKLKITKLIAEAMMLIPAAEWNNLVEVDNTLKSMGLSDEG